MQVPSIVQGDSGKRLFQGAVFGAIATMFVGFYWGGWMLGGQLADAAFSGMEAQLQSVKGQLTVHRNGELAVDHEAVHRQGL